MNSSLSRARPSISSTRIAGRSRPNVARLSSFIAALPRFAGAKASLSEARPGHMVDFDVRLAEQGVPGIEVALGERLIAAHVRRAASRLRLPPFELSAILPIHTARPSHMP